MRPSHSFTPQPPPCHEIFTVDLRHCTRHPSTTCKPLKSLLTCACPSVLVGKLFGMHRRKIAVLTGPPLRGEWPARMLSPNMDCPLNTHNTKRQATLLVVRHPTAWSNGTLSAVVGCFLLGFPGSFFLASNSIVRR